MAHLSLSLRKNGPDVMITDESSMVVAGMHSRSTAWLATFHSTCLLESNSLDNRARALNAICDVCLARLARLARATYNKYK